MIDRDRYSLDVSHHYRAVYSQLIADGGPPADAADAADVITRDEYPGGIDGGPAPTEDEIAPGFFTFDGPFGADRGETFPGHGVILPDGSFIFTEPAGYVLPAAEIVRRAVDVGTAGGRVGFFTATVPVGPDERFTFTGFVSRPVRQND
jgi:hypothetical protein